MCNCIDNFNSRLRANTGDPNAMLDVAHWGGANGKTKSVKMRYLFRARHRNGALAMKLQSKLIRATYCPFCGEKQVDLSRIASSSASHPDYTTMNIATELEAGYFDYDPQSVLDIKAISELR